MTGNIQRAELWAGRLTMGIVIIGFWEFASGRFFNDFWVSRPSAILQRIGEMAASGDLWFHLQTTLEETLTGLLIGMVIGTIAGVTLAFSGQFAGWIFPYIMAVYSLPKVALAPLFVVWFGIGLLSKVLMVTTMVMFVAFYNAFEGVRNIDPDLLDMMRTFRAGRWTTLTWVILPSITTWVLTSLRLGIGLALIGSVIAELVGANRGIGYYITKSAGTLDTTGIFAGLVIIMLVAVALEAGVAQVEKRLLRYR
ncbi:MAG TPA: ABC transporter permease [Candidatus Binatia bacterium]|nr:ABC transporter permease [Candidatus Binatia bacterium]